MAQGLSRSILGRPPEFVIMYGHERTPRLAKQKAEKRFLGMGCHGWSLAGHPSSRRAAMHASLVDAILSPKSRSNVSMMARGGPLSRTFRLGKPKLTMCQPPSVKFLGCDNIVASPCMAVSKTH